jgi:hypothetical protein
MFLYHWFQADGTILTPHIGSAFSSTDGSNGGGHVKLTGQSAEFFSLLKCCEKREHFSVGCYRSG